MKAPLKVLWSEGQIIQVQHLQRQDAYHEARVAQLAQVVHPYLWGVRKVQWNVDALANNMLAAEVLSLVFQDGEMVDAPGTDALPPSVDLRGLPAETESFVFYASLPVLQQHGGNVLREGARLNGERYVPVQAEAADLFSQALEVDLAYLSASVRLAAEVEARQSHLSFPVVKIRRAEAGGFELDPAFIPPSLSVQASPALAFLLRSLMKKLATKLEALDLRLSEAGGKLVEVRSGDLTAFLLMQTMSSAYAALAHIERNRGLHPERLFRELLALAGGLMAFSKAHGPDELPGYEHQALGTAFGALDGLLRTLVDTVISARYFMIPLVRDQDSASYLHGRLEAGKVDEQTQLYLAVNAEMPAIELVAAIPLRLKIGAPDDVEKSVLSALPGVRLVHLPQAPAAVPVRPQTFYFLLEKRGALYENMLKAQAISIYAPAGIAGLSMELIGVAGQ